MDIMDEEAVAIEGAETPAEQVDNLSVDQLTQVRLGETDESEAEEQQETEGHPAAETDKDTTDIDLDSMSEDELKELGARLGSRAVSRFGQMTARAKAAEEKLQRLDASRGNPLETPVSLEDNPYRDLDSLEKLQGKAKEVSEVIEWAEDILENSDGLSSDDEVTEVDGKSYTKAEVRTALKKARKAKESFLPAQLNELRAVDQRRQFKTVFDDRAKQELPWMDDSESEVAKVYQKMIADPRIKKVEKEVPDLAPQLSYLLAHAANSLAGKQAERPAVPTKVGRPKLTPPKPTTSTGAPTSKPEAGRAKNLADLKNRFEKTGNVADFVAFRTAQNSTR